MPNTLANLPERSDGQVERPVGRDLIPQTL
jgi:hypothetical protein